MSDVKRGKFICALLGAFFIIAGVLMLIIAVKIPHYTATITDITDTYTTTRRKRSGGSRMKKYNERVTLEYIDGNGDAKTASNVRVKRDTQSSLPKVGDTIQVKEFLGVGEYGVTTAAAFFIAFLIAGIAFFISALVYGRKKPKTG